MTGDFEICPTGTKQLLIDMAAVFRSYEKMHAEKRDKAAVESNRSECRARHEKAERNREHAERIEKLLGDF